jgi:hypothetical protein
MPIAKIAWFAIAYPSQTMIVLYYYNVLEKKRKRPEHKPGAFT